MPLDFAYRLHSDIGASCTGAIVNGKMVSLNTKLNQGDIVEIITTKNQKPNPGWLDKVFSKHARHKLLAQLNSIFPNFSPHKKEPQQSQDTSKKKKS